MSVFKNLCCLIIFVMSTASVEAETRGAWYLNSSNVGILARVKSGMSSRREFLVVFEYLKKCEPIFASVEPYERYLGEFLSIEPFSPQLVFLTINEQRYTWHGVVTEYSGAHEIGIGITQQAWNALLANPETITFTEQSGEVFEVPVGWLPNGNISKILRQAADLCLKQIR